MNYNQHSDLIKKAAEFIKSSSYTVAFTGAGISVESGIPPFRGKGGIWDTYDSSLLELDNFLKNPMESWKLLVELFYKFFGKAQPNQAHQVLALMENRKILKAVITQNIDNLHQYAGSKNVLEFHGNTKRLICLSCENIIDSDEKHFIDLPPRCGICGGLLKPDITFFGEAIPEPANTFSFEEARKCDVLIVIGSTGEVYPAAFIPEVAKENGAMIIEINIEPSNYTMSTTDVFIQGEAGLIMERIAQALGIKST